MAKLPFGWMPGHWGLSGKTRERARAEYELSGYDRDLRLLEIDSDDDQELKLKIIDLDLKYNRIDQYTHEVRKANLLNEQGLSLDVELLKIERRFEKISKEDFDYQMAELKYQDVTERKLARLELDYKYNKIEKVEYEKARASALDEPWVGVSESTFDPAQGQNGFAFDLDWNAKFVEMLKANGYNGSTEEEVVEQWFEDVATAEYFNEFGFLPESASNNITSSYSQGLTTQTTKLKGGKTSHS